MSISFGLIESKGIVALIEAADVILKNSPAKILGVNKLDNGLIALAITGDYDYVNIAIESAVEASRRVGEIHSFTVIENPSNEVMKIFGDLFTGSIEPKFGADILVDDKSIDLPLVKSSAIDRSARKEKNRKTGIRKEKSENKIKGENVEKKSKQISGEKLLDDSFTIEELPESEINIGEEKISDSILETESEKSLSTIERLRREALGSSTAKTPKVEKQTTSPAKPKEKIDITLSTENAKVDFELISKMNVHKLRHYAREFSDFPIKGREISRANRDELVQLFKKLD